VTITGRDFGSSGSLGGISFVKFGESLGKLISWEDSKIVAKSPRDCGTGIDKWEFLMKLVGFIVKVPEDQLAVKAISKLLAENEVRQAALRAKKDGLEVDVIVRTTAGTSNPVPFVFASK